MKKLLLITLASVLALGTATSCRKNHERERLCVVIFDSQGGSSVADKFVNKGGKMTAPATPTYANHTFTGWYRESAAIDRWDFATDVVESDMTLYAGWEVDSRRPELDALITSTNGFVEADYTAGSWDDLMAALDDATRVADASGSTEAQIADAIDVLQTAIDGLVFIGDLNTAIGTSESDPYNDPNNFTSESWEPFQRALDAAKRVQADRDATQGQVDDALDDLQTAFDNLVRVTA